MPKDKFDELVNALNGERIFYKYNPSLTEEEIRSATVVSVEKSKGTDDDKPVSLIDETENKSEDANQNGNAPVYVNPAKGGPNPFEGGGDTKIEDHDSSEFIGEGDDKPGEGIHF